MPNSPAPRMGDVELTFEDWCTELVRLGGDRYGPQGVVIECGADSWRCYFDMKYSPQDALDEDASYV